MPPYAHVVRYDVLRNTSCHAHTFQHLAECGGVPRVEVGQHVLAVFHRSAAEDGHIFADDNESVPAGRSAKSFRSQRFFQRNIERPPLVLWLGENSGITRLGERDVLFKRSIHLGNHEQDQAAVVNRDVRAKQRKLFADRVGRLSVSKFDDDRNAVLASLDLISGDLDGAIAVAEASLAFVVWIIPLLIAEQYVADPTARADEDVENQEDIQASVKEGAVDVGAQNSLEQTWCQKSEARSSHDVSRAHQRISGSDKEPRLTMTFLDGGKVRLPVEILDLNTVLHPIVDVRYGGGHILRVDEPRDTAANTR